MSNKPPCIKDAHIVGTMRVSINWTTGELIEVDLSKQAVAPFDALQDPAFFNRMQVDEWGAGLDWPGGLDLGADRLYQLCREQAGLPTPEAFDAWMRRNSLSLSTAAVSLGMTRRMIAHYRTGSKPIPKVVGLACKGWEVEHGKQPR